MFRLYRRVMAWAGDVWGWGFMSILGMLLVVLLGFFLNWLGVGGANFVVAFFLVPILLGLMFMPEISTNILAAAVASGIFHQPQTVREEVASFFRSYLNIVKGTVLGLLLVFIFLAAVPLKESPSVFFALAVIIPAIILSASFWGFEGRVGKKLAYWSLIIIAVASFGKLVPNDVYYKVIGITPSAIFNRSETGKVLQKVEEQIINNADQAQAKKLASILNKIKNGEDLTAREQSELDRVRKEIGSKNLPSKIGEVGGSVINSTTSKVKEWWKDWQESRANNRQAELEKALAEAEAAKKQAEAAKAEAEVEKAKADQLRLVAEKQVRQSQSVVSTSKPAVSPREEERGEIVDLATLRNEWENRKDDFLFTLPVSRGDKVTLLGDLMIRADKAAGGSIFLSEKLVRCYKTGDIFLGKGTKLIVEGSDSRLSLHIKGRVVYKTLPKILIERG